MFPVYVFLFVFGNFGSMLCVVVFLFCSSRPIVTGTSVLGVTYAGGVMIMTDTLGSYGGLLRFKSLEWIHQVLTTI